MSIAVSHGAVQAKQLAYVASIRLVQFNNTRCERDHVTGIRLSEMAVAQFEIQDGGSTHVHPNVQISGWPHMIVFTAGHAVLNFVTRDVRLAEYTLIQT